MKNKIGPHGQKLPLDIAGQKFGLLTALSPTKEKNQWGYLYWLFQCDCGKLVQRTVRQCHTALPSCGCTPVPNAGRFQLRDFSGYRNGMVVALRPTNERTSGGYAIWWLRCDCGKEFKRPAYAITRHPLVTSCGCARLRPRGRPRNPNNESHVRLLYAALQKSARERNLDCQLSQLEARALFEAPCFYCGITGSSLITSPQLHGVYPHNGIDRRDNTQGYRRNNCVSCCRWCNFAKSDMTEVEFREHIERAYLHQHS